MLLLLSACIDRRNLGSTLEADLFTRKSWRLTQFFELIKNDREVFIVCRQLANNSRELSVEFFV